jgi:hypothetical protein
VTLENQRLRRDLLESRAANQTASNEEIEMLLDGAEVVLEGRRARERKGLTREQQRIQQEGLANLGINPRGPLQGETDLFNDVETATYGEDQSDLQNRTDQDKDFGSGPRDDNRISYLDPYTKENRAVVLPDGVPTRNAPGESWQERRAIRESALRKGYGFDNERDTGGGNAASADAATRIREMLATGELTLDTPVAEGKTVGQLLARIERSQPGRNSVMADRAEGARAVRATAPSITESARASMSDDRAKGDAIASESGRRRTRKVLDSLPELEPGGKAYVRNENSDDARALMIEDAGAPISVSTEDAFMLDGMQGSSNAQGMQRVKLQDYAIKDPNSPANWSPGSTPMIAAEGYSPARVYYDGSGNIVGGDDPVGYTAPGQVADVSGKGALNVPINPVTVQDLAAQEIAKRQSAERMRQVDISGSLGGLVDRVNASPAGRSGALGTVGQPRSLADLQALVDQVADAERAGGRKMYAFDPTNPGRSRPTTEPTARDILANTLKLSPDEVGNVSQALTMLDAARDTSVPVDASPMARSNHQFKEDYYAGGNAGVTPGARAGANSVAGMIRTIPDTKPVYGVDPTADPNVLGRNALHHIGTMGSKDRVVMGMDKKGNPVKMEVGPQLRGLTGEGLNDLSPTEKDLVLKMARSNQQGTFSGDTSVPRVYQGPIDRRSREDVILGAMNKYESFGKPNDTAGIIKSANRDLQNEAALGATDSAISARRSALDATPSGVRNQEDAIFSESAKRRSGAIDDARSMGEKYAAAGKAVSTGPMIAAGPAGRSGMYRTPVTPVQPIQQSTVAASIAPDPWAGTGPARMEVASQPSAQSAQLALPPARSGRQLTPDLRSELFSLDGPSQGPSPSTRNYMGTPDGAGPTPPSRREQIISSIQDGVDNVAQKAEAFRTSPRYARGRNRAAIGATGLGALAAGLGLSNIGKEEEEEVRF